MNFCSKTFSEIAEAEGESRCCTPGISQRWGYSRRSQGSQGLRRL